MYKLIISAWLNLIESSQEKIISKSENKSISLKFPY